MATLSYQYTEHKAVKGTFVAFEFWSVTDAKQNPLASICIEINFQSLPLMKVDDKYVSKELYIEFESLCVDPKLYRTPEKLIDFLKRCGISN